ncbi:MAG TPA: trehalose-phosphatase [Gaiellaceae bacterium]
MDLLAPLREAPEATALLFDVDGTLAPIAAAPDLARVPDGTKAELRRLAASYLLVACISGRPGAEAAAMVGVDGIRYVGNHGLELVEHAAGLATEIARFRESVDLPVEDKGLSLSYHYRGAEDERAARAELEEVAALARAAGLDPRWGRRVLEIRPSAAADKGTAVAALLHDVSARNGLYAGDDTTDLDAFEGLGRVGLARYVRVAVGSDEGPTELAAKADLVVDGPEGLAALLERL